MGLLKKGFWILLLPLLFSFEARADFGNYGNCCPQYCDSCDDWVVYGEWLYWRSRRCDLDYAVTGAGAGTYTGNIHSVDQSYESGWRIGVQKYCGDFFYDLTYTYFRNDESNSKNNPALSGTRIVDDITAVTQGLITDARGKWDLDYDVVDLLAGYGFCNTSCFQPYIFGGLKLAFIDQKFEALYIEGANFDRVTQKIDMDAYGINLGVGANYNFCHCFNFFGRFSYDVLLGDFTRHYNYETSANADAANFKDDCWRMLSVLNLSFGLGYDFAFSNCWCSNLGISLGYEFHQWVGQPDFIDFQSESGEVTFDRHLQSLGFDGLFLRLALNF